MVAPAERGLGVGGVAAEVEVGLLEGAVRVGEEQEAVEEADGGSGASSERGARLGEEEELGERSTSRWARPVAGRWGRRWWRRHGVPGGGG